MPVSVNTEQYDDLVIIKGIDQLSFHDIVMALRYLYSCQAAGNMLWDFSEASLAPVSTEDILKIVEFSVRNVESRELSKVAIVAPRNLEYGVSRMFQSYGGKLPFDVSIFRAMDEALAWLGKDNYMYALAGSLARWTDINEGSQSKSI